MTGLTEACALGNPALGLYWLMAEAAASPSSRAEHFVLSSVSSARSPPGVRLPGTFMYSCTVFMPKMVWPTWLSMLPVDVTRMKAGSFSSSCSWGFHLWGKGATQMRG